MTHHRARITWAPRPGGSGSLPTSMQYATIARFAEDDSWPNDAWSIVCAFDAPPVLRNPAEATIRFLAAAAPHHRLKPGAIFSLYEGRTDVATVEVLD